MVGGVATDARPHFVARTLACEAPGPAARRQSPPSNSLLEALVFGERSGRGASAHAGASRAERLHPIHNAIPTATPSELDVVDIRNSLSSLMFRDVGIERTETTLTSAQHSVDFWCQYALIHEFADPSGWELQNLLTIAGLVVQSALARTESRGTHYRADHPATDDRNWRAHLTATRSPVRLVRTCLDVGASLGDSERDQEARTAC